MKQKSQSSSDKDWDFFLPGRQLYEENMANEYDQCHGKGAENGRIHDYLCRIIGIIAEFDGKHGRVDSCRYGRIDEKYQGTDSCEGSR